jgi:hypothetical protein
MATQRLACEVERSGAVRRRAGEPRSRGGGGDGAGRSLCARLSSSLWGCSYQRGRGNGFPPLPPLSPNLLPPRTTPPAHQRTSRLCTLSPFDSKLECGIIQMLIRRATSRFGCGTLRIGFSHDFFLPLPPPNRDRFRRQDEGKPHGDDGRRYHARSRLPGGC